MKIRERTIQGVIWSGLAHGGQHMSRLLGALILVRLLSPDAFGLVALATVFTELSLIFGGLGLKDALIHRQDLDEPHFSSLFWLQVSCGILLMLSIIVAAPVLGGFYDRPDLTQILVVLSINCVVVPLANIHQVILIRAMDFKALAKCGFTANVMAAGTAVAAAWMGFGVWSLVAQSLVFRATNVLMLWISAPWRPRLIISLDAIRHVFPFGAYMTAVGITDYCVKSVDRVLIGKFLGMHALGFYTLADRIVTVPLRSGSTVINGVAFPAFSKFRHDLERTRTNYIKMLRAMSVLSLPAAAALFATLPEIVDLVFGPGWEPVVFLGRVFCFGGMLSLAGATVRTIYQSQGRPDIDAKFSLFVSLPATILAIMAGLPYGLEGVAICYTIRTALLVSISHALANRLIGLAWSRFVQSQFRGYVIALTVGLIMLLAGELGERVLSPSVWLLLVLKGGLGVCVLHSPE